MSILASYRYKQIGNSFTEIYRGKEISRNYLGAVGRSGSAWVAYGRDGAELARFRDEEEAISEVIGAAEKRTR